MEAVLEQGCVQYRNSLQTFRNSRVLEIGNFAKRFICKRFDTERGSGLRKWLCESGEPRREWSDNLELELEEDLLQRGEASVGSEKTMDELYSACGNPCEHLTRSRLYWYLSSPSSHLSTRQFIEFSLRNGENSPQVLSGIPPKSFVFEG